MKPPRDIAQCLLLLTATFTGCLTSQAPGPSPQRVQENPPRASEPASGLRPASTESADVAVVRTSRCVLPEGLASGPGAVSSREALLPLCKLGKTESLVSTASAWFRAAPSDAMAVNWLSQALYVRALERDGLRSPCAAEPVFIDRGPPSDPAEAVLYEANQNAQIGWNHIIRTPAALRDAEASLCLAETALASRFDSTLFRRRLRILMDLGRDSELREAIRGLTSTPKGSPGGAAIAFVPYVPDYLGVGREIEAGELSLLLRELDPPAASRLEPFRRAIVLQMRRRYQKGTSARQEREAWISSHDFDQSWAPEKARGRRAR
jgi:hypothetical protein